jgi:type IX secretion system PorP/SprF family membrane protein
MKRLIILALIYFSLGTISQAQQRPNTSLFSVVVPMTQPGWMGVREKTEIILGTRKQWLGWDGAPSTQYLGWSTSILNNRIGLGGNYFRDQTGARKLNSGNIVVNYKSQITSSGLKLAAGISAGFIRFNFDPNGLMVENNNDNQFVSYQSKTSFVFGCGASIQKENWTIGVYCPQLNQSKFSMGDSTNYLLRNQWNLFSNYLMKVNSIVSIQGALNMAFVRQGRSNAELSLIPIWDEKFGLGLSYRYHESFGIPVQFRISPQFTIHYAYDFPIQQMISSQSGTHELMLNFQISTKPKATLNPRFF